MSRIIIVHGTMGSPDINWFPWLKNELEAQGHDVIVPHFPTPEGQTPDNWLKTLDDAVPHWDEEVLLIGHSIGATFLLHLLNRSDRHARQTIFVAPVFGLIDFPEYERLNKRFYDADFDLLTIRNHMGEARVFYSDSDPYVPSQQPKNLAAQLEIPITEIPDGGHLNAESGYTRFPQLLELIG